jgi:hypothetical protein
MVDQNGWDDISGAFGEISPEAVKPKFGLKANAKDAGSMRPDKSKPTGLQFKPADSNNRYNRPTGERRDSNSLGRARGQTSDSLHITTTVAPKKV